MKYILAAGSMLMLAAGSAEACGPYYPDDPGNILMFECCTPELASQWRQGCRFQDYEKEENCLLWQRITSKSIPVHHIDYIVYGATLKELSELGDKKWDDNKFAQWLRKPSHKEDLDYLLVAKEIEEIRNYMNNPWYYPYEGDEEHQRLSLLQEQCAKYKGRRHADRYALQIARLFFAQKNYQGCIDLWESKVSGMPENIVTDMIASYAGGAYYRQGDREKAIELYTRAQDIGSLISLKVWKDSEDDSRYKDAKVRELEYVFNRFPDSPLLSIRLQEYVTIMEAKKRDSDSWEFDDWKDPVYHNKLWTEESRSEEGERKFYEELKSFAKEVVASKRCRQKGLWNYALAYLYHLEGNNTLARKYLSRAEASEVSPHLKESVHAFRFLLDGMQADGSQGYRKRLLKEMKWLDEMMSRDAGSAGGYEWQYVNRLNWSVGYWQDVARRVLLGEICPRLVKVGDMTLALQLANYATNRIYQLRPLYNAYYYDSEDEDDSGCLTSIISFDELRKSWKGFNSFDYDCQFFDMMQGCTADQGAAYAERIAHPRTELDKFLNTRSYVDPDYIYDIVGTLYLREMNYREGVHWLSRVSEDYQGRTNLEKCGYMRRDPFQCQSDKRQMIADSSDYKLRFAQEMEKLERLMTDDSEPNRRAKAKLRFATGLRNSFGRCWYLTGYGFLMAYDTGDEENYFKSYSSADREGFAENPYAQKAYRRVDRLMAEAFSEFTDAEAAAQAHLEMKNFKTIMQRYPGTKSAEYVRGHCDRYTDYALQKK